MGFSPPFLVLLLKKKATQFGRTIHQKKTGSLFPFLLPRGMGGGCAIAELLLVRKVSALLPLSLFFASPTTIPR